MAQNPLTFFFLASFAEHKTEQNQIKSTKKCCNTKCIPNKTHFEIPIPNCKFVFCTHTELNPELYPTVRSILPLNHSISKTSWYVNVIITWFASPNLIQIFLNLFCAQLSSCLFGPHSPHCCCCFPSSPASSSPF